eukprot:SAG11_NODE_12061_length_723_cov_2.363782_1_plen_97_part_00
MRTQSGGPPASARSSAIRSERIIADIDRSAGKAQDAIIAAFGTIVDEYDNRNGHRKVAARLTKMDLEQRMLPQCAEAMKAQQDTWAGMSGPRSGDQ